jgi:hypothetical protein
MTIKRCFATAGLALALGALQLGSASADDMKSSTMMPAIDCSTANDHMMKMVSSPNSDAGMMKADASVDKNFMMSMHMMMESQMMLAKIELKCGKNDKAKAEAQKLLDSMQSYSVQAMEIQREIP